MSSQDVETAAQAAKYRDLLERIAQAKARGQDFELRGAKQIALFRWGDERKLKWVFKKSRAPYTRDGVIICLSVETWGRWQKHCEYCSIHGLDPVREAHKFGFGPPASNKDEFRKKEPLPTQPYVRVADACD
jgi:hypothetical protein